ncbi:MAG: hypothetical protein H7Z37_12610, partial [Pyrinomonadaceae bacterium]|nr:hypothetical protein [Pyrinomonadaceae bacterium]
MQNLIRFYLAVTFAAFFIFSANPDAIAQTQTDKPLTQQEFVKLLFDSSKSDVKRSALVETVRKRGIGFELTSGVRGLIASKSGNDETLRRTIEESARRKSNPTAAALPSEKEAGELLDKTRKATLEAVE